MIIFCTFEFSSDFVGEGKLNNISAIEIYSFNDKLKVLFISDPSKKD